MSNQTEHGKAYRQWYGHSIVSSSNEELFEELAETNEPTFPEFAEGKRAAHNDIVTELRQRNLVAW
jgi:hypothetical protein